MRVRPARIVSTSMAMRSSLTHLDRIRRELISTPNTDAQSAYRSESWVSESTSLLMNGEASTTTGTIVSHERSHERTQ
jgi:hypothetical protein